MSCSEVIFGNLDITKSCQFVYVEVIKTKTKAMLVYVLNVIVHGPTKAQELLHNIHNLLMSQKICGSCILSNKSQDELAGSLVYM